MNNPLFPFSGSGIQILYFVGKRGGKARHGSVDVCESGYMRDRMKGWLKKVLHSDPTSLLQKKKKCCWFQLSEGNSNAPVKCHPKIYGPPTSSCSCRSSSREEGQGCLSLTSLSVLLRLHHLPWALAPSHRWTRRRWKA